MRSCLPSLTDRPHLIREEFLSCLPSATTGEPIPVRVFGGPTALFEYGGLRFLTDPTFDAPGDYPRPDGPVLTKTAPSSGSPADLGRIDVVLLSHDEHPDNLDHSGRALLADVPAHPHHPRRRTAPRRQGAKGLADWESVELDRPGGGTVTVTGVPAIHGPGPREEVEAITGEVVGFVLTGDGLPTVYVSGDNASLDAVKEIAERFGPVDTAVLFAGAPRFPGLFDGAPLVLDSAQAAEATADPRRPPGGPRPLRQLGPLHRGPRRTWWPPSPPRGWPTAWTWAERAAPAHPSTSASNQGETTMPWSNATDGCEIYYEDHQHSLLERQKEVAAGIDARVAAHRKAAKTAGEKRDGETSGTQRAREVRRGLDNKEAPGRWPGALRWSG